MDDWQGMDVTRKQRTIAGPRRWKASATGADATSASSSGRRSPRRGSSSCAAICRAARGFPPPSPTASKAAADRASLRRAAWTWSSTSWRPWPACKSTTAKSGSTRPEMPGCDGSALAFVAALQQAGIVEQDGPARADGSPRRCAWATKSLDRGPPAAGGKRSSDTNWTTAAATPSAGNRWKSRSRRGSSTSTWPPAGPSCWSAKRPPCRPGPRPRATFRDLLVFDADGPIDNTLRFPDECVRHKIVDMVGDLALAGCDLAGRFVAYRSGHRLNAELVRAMLERPA